MTHEESEAAAILATAEAIEEGEVGEDDSDDEILNNPDKFRDESLGTLPAVRVRRDVISTLDSPMIVSFSRRPLSAQRKTSSTATATLSRGTSSSRS